MLTLENTKVKQGNKIFTLPPYPHSRLHINQGEIVGLTGASGCGKSTAARILAGHLTIESGLRSVPSFTASLNAPQANQVQWISQQPEWAFNPRWRLLKSLQEAINKQAPLTSTVRMQELLVRYQVTPEWLYRFPQQLSGGELQRLNIVRALLASPRFLLCDEITAQLDPLTQKMIWQQLIQDAISQKMGLLVISHNKALLKALCSRVVDWGNSRSI